MDGGDWGLMGVEGGVLGCVCLEYRCCSCHKKMDYTGKKTCEACLTKRKQRYVKKKTPRRTWEFANEEEFRKFISNHEGYCLVQR